jgi:outer membrane protein assembly factor BamD
VEPIKGGAPPPNQPVPRSDAQPGTPAAAPDNSADTGIPELKPLTPADGTDAGSSSAAGSSSKPATPPAQVNEAAGDQANAPANAGSSSSASKSTDAASAPVDKDTTSTSKKKKKKGLGKLNPF